MPGVNTEILVSEHVVTAAHDEAAKRPVPLADGKFPAAGIL
jgi:hypothetical protein